MALTRKSESDVVANWKIHLNQPSERFSPFSSHVRESLIGQVADLISIPEAQVGKGLKSTPSITP